MVIVRSECGSGITFRAYRNNVTTPSGQAALCELAVRAYRAGMPLEVGGPAGDRALVLHVGPVSAGEAAMLEKEFGSFMRAAVDAAA